MRILTHLRGNAVAYLALFVALGGTSYAAVKLPANSVGSKQLKKGSVSSSKLTKSLRTQLAVKTGGASVGASGAVGPTGAVGPMGASGAPGAPGAPGADGVLASSFASASIVGGTALTSSLQSVLSLTAAGLGLTSAGTITTTAPARLVASASVEIFRGTNSDALAGRATCSLKRATDRDPAAQIGQGRETTFEAAPGTTDAAFRTISLDAAVDVEAGTHDVQVACSRFDRASDAINAPLTARHIDLTVLALRR